MSVIGSVSSGMSGALLLARGRPEGIELVDTDHTAAVRSFWAIPLCLPAVVCLKLLDWLATGIPANPPLALGRYLLLFLVGWLVGWLLFVWATHYMAGMLNKQPLWARFIAVWSYCSVIENTLVAIGGLPGALGAPSIIDQAAELVTFGWALWLEWFGIRLSLQVGPLTAIMVLAVDVGIGIAMGVLGGLSG
jgi:hypothetical protein